MKYYENLDDYTDTRQSMLMEFTKRFLPAVIFIAQTDPPWWNI